MIDVCILIHHVLKGIGREGALVTWDEEHIQVTGNTRVIECYKSTV